MKSKYDYDIIRDYLHGLTDQETTNRIRDLIRTDEIARNIAAGILQLEHEFGGNEEEIEAYIESLRQKQKSLIVGRNSYRIWIGMAAAILLLAVVGSVIWLRQGDLLEDELSEPYPLAILDRSESNTGKGFEFYIKRDYKNAVNAFDPKSTDVSEIFYNGLSNLYAGNYDRAIQLLSSEPLKSSRYKQQADWFIALALLKSDKKEAAKKALGSISNDPAHYKSEEARKLLSSGVN